VYEGERGRIGGRDNKPNGKGTGETAKDGEHIGGDVRMVSRGSSTRRGN